MRKIVAAGLGLLLAVVWVTSGLRNQASVGPQDATARAQLTAVTQPTPSPTP